MSRLKTSENLFLEVNELQRFKKFIEDDGYKRLIKTFINSYGIVQNDDNSNFKVTIKSGTSNVVNINSGLAFDNNLDAIVSNEKLEFTINNTGIKRWLILSRDITNSEEGTVTINSDGTMTGIGTKFSEILRNQTNFPIKIKFENSLFNLSEYEVVKVISDTSVILSGTFAVENDLKYSVIGTFTPGFQPLEKNKTIYEYDSYNISIIDSEDTPTLNENEFILASIKFDASEIMSVSDERGNYYFNNNLTQSIEKSSENPLVNLLAVNVIGGINSVDTISANFELILEHGYTILTQKLNITSNNNIFNILSGKSNFLGTGDIPDSLFKGWLLLNKKNMKYAVIDNNINKVLYISVLDTSMIEDEGNEFIVIPNFKEIEFEVKVSNNVNKTSIPFYFKKSMLNSFSRINIYSFMPSVSSTFSDVITISLKYRMIDGSDTQYPFNNLSVAQYININDQTETLADSTFEVNLADIEPQAKEKNYS